MNTKSLKNMDTNALSPGSASLLQAYLDGDYQTSTYPALEESAIARGYAEAAPEEGEALPAPDLSAALHAIKKVS